MDEAPVVIVGGGASGLAVAATLRRRGIDPVVLDAGERVGESWARRYDRLGRAMRRLANGDLRAHGLGPEAWGPFGARRPPVVDAGFLAHLKAGRIAIRPAVAALTPAGARFADGRSEPDDAVVCATGYATGLERLIARPGLLDARGMPTGAGAKLGLFFAGFAESPRGQLFEASRSAHGLARAIDLYLKGSTA